MHIYGSYNSEQAVRVELLEVSDAKQHQNVSDNVLFGSSMFPLLMAENSILKEKNALGRCRMFL